MDDTEENKSFIETTQLASTPLRLCRRFQCRFRQPQLQLYELYQLYLFIGAAQMLFGIVVVCMREPLNVRLLLHGNAVGPAINGRWLPLFALAATLFQYAFSYVNVLSKGWGDPNSRFWCDLRIMYIRGFNTVRTTVRFFSVSVCMLFAMCLSGMAEVSTVVFMVILTVMAEWQLGVLELANQYDTQLRSKAGEFVSLEALQYVQTQRTAPSKTNWSPMVIAAIVKTTTWALVYVYSSSVIYDTSYTFIRPLILTLTCYTYVVPLLEHFVYQKNLLTFCELELHRMFSDIFFLLIVVTFSLI
jgi:hypothetical protein